MARGITSLHRPNSVFKERLSGIYENENTIWGSQKLFFSNRLWEWVTNLLCYYTKTSGTVAKNEQIGLLAFISQS